MYKTLVSILLLFITKYCIAQNYASIEKDSSITNVNLITWQNLKQPIFLNNASASFGRALLVNPNNTFYIYQYSCYSNELTGGGTWKLINGNTAEFKIKDTLYRQFNIIKFLGDSYFIQPAEHNSFIEDIGEVKKEMINRAQFTDTTISSNSIAKKILNRKYAHW